MSNDSTILALREACRCFGSAAALARALGVTGARVSQMLSEGRVTPALAMRIEAVTGGRVVRAALRPDLWGDVHAA